MTDYDETLAVAAEISRAGGGYQTRTSEAHPNVLLLKGGHMKGWERMTVAEAKAQVGLTRERPGPRPEPEPEPDPEPDEPAPPTRGAVTPGGDDAPARPPQTGRPPARTVPQPAPRVPPRPGAR